MSALKSKSSASALNLSPEGLAILRTMAKGELAWQDASTIAASIGWDIEKVEDLLSQLETTGWIDVWEPSDATSPLITFSVLGASRLGIRIVEVGPTELPRWATADELDPPMPRAKGVSIDPRGATLEAVVDTTLGPPELAANAEAALIQYSTKSGKKQPPLPLPILLLGQGMTWQGPMSVKLETMCPSCRSRQLAAREYCLICDNWGLDYLISAIQEPIRPSRSQADRRQLSADFRQKMKRRREEHRNRLRGKTPY